MLIRLSLKMDNYKNYLTFFKNICDQNASVLSFRRVLLFANQQNPHPQVIHIPHLTNFSRIVV